MKKNLLQPGFELIFSAGVVLCLILPPVVMAQNHKEFKVTINNGDTTINGKNIKDMNAGERKDALNELNGMGGRPERMMVENDGNPQVRVRSYTFKRDSLDRGPRSQSFAFNSDEHGAPMTMTFRRREENGDGEPREMNMNRNRDDFRMPRRNTESFSYANVNKDGISTNVNYEVSDAHRESVKKITGVDKAELMLNDLILTPAFSTGKTNISFSLAEKGSAEIEFKDSDGKVLWSEKISSSLNKSFELPQNGIYYLQVKQNGKIGLRRIVKES